MRRRLKKTTSRFRPNKPPKPKPSQHLRHLHKSRNPQKEPEKPKTPEQIAWLAIRREIEKKEDDKLVREQCKNGWD